MEFNFKSYNNSKQSISYCEVDKCKAVVDLKQQLDQLKAENEEWKKANDCILTTLNVIAEGNKKLRQTLTEIKEICQIKQSQSVFVNETVFEQILQICDEVNDNV